MTIEAFLRSGIDELRSKPPQALDLLRRFLISPVYLPIMFIKQLYQDKPKANVKIFFYVAIVLVIGLVTEEIFRKTAFSLPFFAFTPRLLEIFVYGLIGGVIFIDLFGFFAFLTHLDGDSRFLSRLKKEYLKVDPSLSFQNTEYAEAAQLLETLKPTSYKKLIELYPKRTVDLLLLSKTVWIFNGHVQRLVSPTAIKEDRETLSRDD